jgi:MHS family alpha-ketoglutarate permease-like MFS transporter
MKLQNASQPKELSPLSALAAGASGNLIEWYDFYVYAAFSLYFADSFFPNADPIAQMLSTSGVFALGFFMRPIGALIFGRIGDRVGRGRALTLSVVLMCSGSLLIAVTPSYAVIGIAAPSILLLARMLQGVSLGGEYGSSAAYLAEIAPKNLRGFYSSFQTVTMLAGQLLALGVLIILQNLFLDSSELKIWGWRIPFAFGGLLASVAFWLRRGLVEPKAFKQASKESHQGSLSLLLHHRRETATVIGLTLGGTIAFYTYTTYMQKFLKLSTGLNHKETSWILAGSLLFAIVLQPLYGALSDRIGRRPMLITFGALGVLLTCPLLNAIQQATSPGEAFILICCGWLIISFYTSINAIVKAELFPATIRVTGVALPYALTVSLFGGSAEYVALSFKSHGHEDWFYIYVSLAISISLCVFVAMTDTKGKTLK